MLLSVSWLFPNRVLLIDAHGNVTLALALTAKHESERLSAHVQGRCHVVIDVRSAGKLDIPLAALLQLRPAVCAPGYWSIFIIPRENHLALALAEFYRQLLSGQVRTFHDHESALAFLASLDPDLGALTWPGEAAAPPNRA